MAKETPNDLLERLILENPIIDPKRVVTVKQMLKDHAHEINKEPGVKDNSIRRPAYINKMKEGK